MLPLKTILCPTDFSDPSREAVKVAGELAAHFLAEIILLHVLSPISPVPVVMEAVPPSVPVPPEEVEASAKTSLEEMVRELKRQGLSVRAVTLWGNPADEIVQAAERENADLTVIATRGRSGLDRFLFGSVAEKVVRLSKCPVLTVSGNLSAEAGKEAPASPGQEPETEEPEPAKREAYLKAIYAQLEKWQAKIEELKTRAAKSQAGSAENEGRILDLKFKMEQVRQKTLELEKTGKEAWAEAKAKLENELEEVKAWFDETGSKIKGAGADWAKKSVEKKEGYVKKVETQLRDWGVKIDSLKVKAESSAAGAKAAYLKQIEEIGKKQEAAKRKLQELGESGDLAWQDLKSGVDQVLEDLKKSVKQAISRFKEK
jgi:nucleotide-binding universal stress UspA family protein